MSLEFGGHRVHLPTSPHMAQGVGGCLNRVPSHTQVLLAEQGNEYGTDVT
jgi:hypothetical protein